MRELTKKELFPIQIRGECPFCVGHMRLMQTGNQECDLCEAQFSTNMNGGFLIAEPITHK